MWIFTVVLFHEEVNFVVKWIKQWISKVIVGLKKVILIIINTMWKLLYSQWKAHLIRRFICTTFIPQTAANGSHSLWRSWKGGNNYLRGNESPGKWVILKWAFLYLCFECIYLISSFYLMSNSFSRIFSLPCLWRPQMKREEA